MPHEFSSPPYVTNNFTCDTQLLLSLGIQHSHDLGFVFPEHRKHGRGFPRTSAREETQWWSLSHPCASIPPCRRKGFRQRPAEPHTSMAGAARLRMYSVIEIRMLEPRGIANASKCCADEVLSSFSVLPCTPPMRCIPVLVCSPNSKNHTRCMLRAERYAQERGLHTGQAQQDWACIRAR